MSELLRHAWWIIGLLALLKIGVLAALYQSRRTIKLQRKKEQEMRLEYGELLTALRNLREEHVNLVRKQQTLLRHVKAVSHAVVEISLPGDILAAYGGGSVYLPRVCHNGQGVVTVIIPGVNEHVYTIHVDPKEQTSDERERIYGALRHSKEARAELGIDVS